MIVGSWIVAILYAAVFARLGEASWYVGASGGAMHAAFVLVVLMEVLPGVHPRMVSECYGPTQNQQLEPPEFLALNYGLGTPIVTVIAHLAYGLVLGSFYQVGGQLLQ